MQNQMRHIANRLEAIECMLQNIAMKIPRSESTQQSALTNGIELAERITGLKKSTIYNLVQQRKIPHYKRGKRLYFDQKELLDWIRKGKRKTLDELHC